jgi:transcriptional regulator with XRE-family HTH domain
MRFSDWFREQEGLTQDAFARSVGVTQGRIAQLLSGDTPSFDLAARIHNATDGTVTPNDFLEAPSTPEEQGAAS